MLEYLESSSMDRQFSFDGSQVLSQDIAYTNQSSQSETIYNIVVAECLRGVIFNKIGDHINICIRYTDGKSDLENLSGTNNIAQDKKLCLRKAKARIIATSNKVPGFVKFSGYKQINFICPDIIMSTR